MKAVVKRHASPLLGVSYIVVLALLITMSILTYRKALPWQGTVRVTLTTTTPGLELNPLSDVKLQGVRVGEVRRITSNGQAATIEIALDPDKISLIPANVDAAIVPKTLFGEKFVDLRTPASPSSARIAAGSVIKQSTTSVEIGQLFSNLVPVLEALKPEQLSVMLSSMAQALDGRGETMAETLNQLQGFLHEVDPHLDTLTHDIVQFAKTADVYADAAPDLISILSSTAAISRELLMPKEQKFEAFLDQVIASSDKTKQVLQENAQHLITLSGKSRPVLAVLDEYAVGLPCLLRDLHTADTLATQTVGAHGPFVNLVATQKPYTYPDDLPSNPKSDGNNANLPSQIPSWKPHCAQFAPYVYQLTPVTPYSQPMPGQTAVPARGQQTVPQARPADAAVAEARSAMARAVAAQLMSVPQGQVPGYAELLIGPMLSGGTVDVR